MPSSLYKVVITEAAEWQLLGVSNYIVKEYGDYFAANNILDDFEAAKDRLKLTAASHAFCEIPALRKYQYRVVHFHHKRYRIIYRVVDDMAVIEGIFGPGQDYPRHLLRRHRK